MLFLLDLPRGEEVTILAQKKKDGEQMDVAFMYCLFVYVHLLHAFFSQPFGFQDPPLAKTIFESPPF